MTKVKFRDSQSRILNYQGGLMGISAVPGSGKTFTLSHLAAKLVMESDLAYDQEVLIVTFSNVAADNFTSRIGAILSEQGIVEGIGYKVRTLHGLASDIIRERPDLAGLGNDFSIIDASESTEILQDLIRNQMMQKLEIFDKLVSDSYRCRNNDAKIEKELLTELHRIVTVYIKTAKDHLLSVEELQTHINKTESPTSLLLICQEIFRSYQAALNYRGAVDFDDLIRLAWLSLNNDADLLNPCNIAGHTSLKTKPRIRVLCRKPFWAYLLKRIKTGCVLVTLIRPSMKASQLPTRNYSETLLHALMYAVKPCPSQVVPALPSSPLPIT